MKQLIDSDFTKEELDSFLKKRYGYGIWEFEFSIANIIMFYSEKNLPKFSQFIENRIKRLENMKNKVIELLDDFLSDVNFYKLNKDIRLTEITSWTPKNRYDFIIKGYQLSDFFSIIDNQISLYQSREVSGAWEKFGNSTIFPPELRVFPPRLKPLNLLLLIWSYAMKRGKKVDWINMENLLNWFSKTLNEIEALEFIGMEENEAPFTEILRLTRNKYKKSKYDIFAKVQFDLFFNIKKDEGKERYPKPLDDLDQFLKWEYKDIESMKHFCDFHMLIPWMRERKILRNLIVQN